MRLFIGIGLPETDNDLVRGFRGGADARRFFAVMRKWREAAGWVAAGAGLRAAEKPPVCVSLRTIGQTRRDPGASMLVAKAIVDGLLGHFGDHGTTVVLLPPENRGPERGVEVEIGGAP